MLKLVDRETPRAADGFRRHISMTKGGVPIAVIVVDQIKMGSGPTSIIRRTHLCELGRCGLTSYNPVYG